MFLLYGVQVLNQVGSGREFHPFGVTVELGAIKKLEAHWLIVYTMKGIVPN
jgi:hypothetical protein